MAHWGIALASGPHINFPMVPPPMVSCGEGSAGVATGEGVAEGALAARGAVAGSGTGDVDVPTGGLDSVWPQLASSVSATNDTM